MGCLPYTFPTLASRGCHVVMSWSLTYPAALRYEIGNDYEYDFLDGEYPWPQAKGIREVFGDRQIGYSYFDGSTESVLKAVDDLSAYTEDHGPFEAVIGFSLGAALAATLLLRCEKRHAQLLIRCAIFLCGTLPCDTEELIQEDDCLRLMQAKDVHNAIKIPTLHVWSPNDVDYPGQSAQLIHMCEPTRRFEVIHSRGHSIPSQGGDLIALARAVQRIFGSLDEFGMHSY